MNPAFAKVVPTVFAEVRDALLAATRAEIAERLATVRIERCTLAEEEDIGYVYFMRPPPSSRFKNLAAPVAETIAFFSELGINIDVDHDGNLFGLEFLERPDLVACLRGENEL
jgi:hypothetical protein